MLIDTPGTFNFLINLGVSFSSISITLENSGLLLMASLLILLSDIYAAHRTSRLSSFNKLNNALTDVSAALRNFPNAIAEHHLISEFLSFNASVRNGIALAPPGAILPRSEERRVGKECRSRWSPC